MSALWQSWLHGDLPWLVLTVGAYLLAVWLYKRSNFYPLLVPVFTAVALVVAVLLATNTPYAQYRAGVQWLTFLIGPATVALGVPLYTQRQRIRALWRPIAVALLVGCVVGLTGAMGIAWVLGGSWQTLVSLAPKSATIPIALPMAERLGGEPSLAAVAVAVTGVAGVMLSGLCRRLLLWPWGSMAWQRPWSCRWWWRCLRACSLKGTSQNLPSYPEPKDDSDT